MSCSACMLVLEAGRCGRAFKQVPDPALQQCILPRRLGTLITRKVKIEILDM